MPTLNYDPTEADQPEFSEEELDSLKVGEQAVEQHEQLLAGKFEDAEQLEKAYIELQRKLGQPNEQEQEELRETEATEEVNPILDLIDEARTSDEFDLSKFKDLDPQEVAKTFLDNTEGGVDLSEKEVNFIKGSVGGDEAYGELMSWANESLDEAYVSAFDKLVETGNGPAIQLAVAGLMAQYEANNGRDGQLLSGKGAPPAQADVFRSQAEVVRAMNDPRYDTDPAYRNDVFEKLGRSNLDTY